MCLGEEVLVVVLPGRQINILRDSFAWGYMGKRKLCFCTLSDWLEESEPLNTFSGQNTPPKNDF